MYLNKDFVGWIVSLQYLYVGILIPIISVFGDQALKELIKLRWVH
jgi:hypothetical protein